jgi:hypothetical protein
MKRISSFVVIAWVILTACSSSGNTPIPPTPFPQLTATEVKVLPTPSSPGNSISWDGLQVTMNQFEVTGEYLTDFGSTRVPPAGGKFLWVHIGLKNAGPVQMDVPASEHFSVLYAAAELKPTYGHREGYTDYTTLSPLIFPDQSLDGWLRFDIPAAAQLNELQFVFIPESAQIGASYSSPNYPYAEDKPTYVWKFTP